MGFWRRGIRYIKASYSIFTFSMEEFNFYPEGAIKGCRASEVNPRRIKREYSVIRRLIMAWGRYRTGDVKKPTMTGLTAIYAVNGRNTMIV